MKTRLQYGAVALVAALLSASVVQAVDEELQNAAQKAKADFQQADSSLTNFFTSSAGYAVFPNAGKGGLVVGGAHGKGLVYQNGKVIGQATMSQGSIGAQVGGQTFDELIFFQTPAALEDFKSGKFELSAEVSAVAAKQGAASAAGYRKGVAVFTLPKKGLMAQASVGGQKFTFQPEPLQPTGR